MQYPSVAAKYEAMSQAYCHFFLVERGMEAG
jgi:hypothetical protein